MVQRRREYPLFSACGLNCGLCPRAHTEGTSRCPGCAGEGFWEKHPSCGVLSCSQRHGVAYCFLCGEFPCARYEGADLADSFITHRNQLRDLKRAQSMGMRAYEAELNRKVELLKILLKDFDDGRRKSFFCTAVNLLDMQDVEAVMAQILEQTDGGDSGSEKAAAAVRLFQAMADRRNLALRLRKKQKPS